MSTEHKIILDYSYSDESSAKKALSSAIQHFETVGLKVECTLTDLIILDGKTELERVAIAYLNDYYTISKLHALAERKEVENYLNDALPRFAALGWQVKIHESRVTPMLDATRTTIRVVIVDGRTKDYSISLEGVYQLDLDLERAECRRALIRALPKFKAENISVHLYDTNFKARVGVIDLNCEYTFQETRALLEKVGETIAAQTFKYLAEQM